MKRSMTHDPWDGSGDGEHFVSGTIRAAVWRIVASIFAPIAWLSFTLLFLGFWAHGFTVAQDIVVGAVSALTLLGFLLAVWVSFGFRITRRWSWD